MCDDCGSICSGISKLNFYVNNVIEETIDIDDKFLPNEFKTKLAGNNHRLIHFNWNNKFL